MIRRQLMPLVRLTLPVTATQLGMMTMGIVDMVMVGKYNDEYDPQAFGAVALGDMWIFGTMIVALGLLMGLDPIVSQSHGAGKHQKTGLALQQGIVLATLVSIPLMILWYLSEWGLHALGQEPQLVPKAAEYARMQLFSAAPFLIFSAHRQYLQGRGMMTVVLWVILIANLANVLFNWVFIFGNLGAPQLGHQGAGIATGISRCVQLLILLAWIRVFKLHGEAKVPWSRESFRNLRRILRYGLPVAAQIGLEVWAFQAAGLMAGSLGRLQNDTEGGILGAHIVALKLASVSFMLPFSLSIATATRVGHLLGAKRREEAAHASSCALLLGSAVMLFTAAVFVIWRHQLPRLFREEEIVVSLAATLLPVAAAFQLFDGLQAVAAGILRGMGTTLPTAIVNLVGFYGISLPISWWLTFHTEVGLRGVWWGLCSGLAVVAASLLIWLYIKNKSVRY